MKYRLRPYQESAKDQVYQKIREGKRKILIWSATGSGKGMMMSDFINDANSRGVRTITVMRRRELIFQTKANYDKYHQLDASVIMANAKGYSAAKFHQVCSIDTIRGRMVLEEFSYLTSSKVVIIDECQDTNSPTYKKFFKWMADGGNDPIFLGFTATPFTVGGQPLDFWEDVVTSITPAELRDQGWLVPDLHYAPEAKISTLGLDIDKGDFKTEDLFDRAANSKLVGDIVSTWLKYGEMRPTIMFCVNKDHSMLMTAAFNQRGIPAIHVDESTTAKERAMAIEGLKSGKYKVMSNIETMTTGVDCPAISCVIFGRPTWSEVLYCQSIGRGLRPYKICADCRTEYGGERECPKCQSTLLKFEKKDCIILDHAANAERHGFAYDVRRPQLKLMMDDAEKKKYASRGKAKVGVPITMCPPCFTYVKPGMPCPRCQVVYRTDSTVKVEGGELKLIDESTVKKLRLNQMLGQYEFFKKRAMAKNYADSSVWHSMFKKFDDMLFEEPYKSALSVPDWFQRQVWAKKQEKVLQGE